jgi:hypothetical protein
MGRPPSGCGSPSDCRANPRATPDNLPSQREDGDQVAITRRGSAPAHRQPEPLGGTREPRLAFGVGVGDGREQRAVGLGIAARLGPDARPLGQQAGRPVGLDGGQLALAIERGQPLALDRVRRRDALGDVGRSILDGARSSSHFASCIRSM